MLEPLDKITALILTYNEEANIKRLLDQLRWVREIVVIDSYSSDATAEICGEYKNVRFVQRTFDNHGAQWQYGLNLVDSDWVLAMDADYFPTDAVIGELATLAYDSNAYTAHFDYCIDGNKVRGSIYPPVNVLFRKKNAHYIQDGHTHRVVIDGTVAQLENHFLHDDRKSFGHWLDSQTRYARLEATKLLNCPTKELNINSRIRRLGWLAPWLVPILVLMRGALFNKAGWVYASERAIAEWILARTIWKMRLEGKS